MCRHAIMHLYGDGSPCGTQKAVPVCSVADRLPDQHPVLRVEIHAIAGLYIVEIQKLIELLKCAVYTQIGQGMDVFFDAVKRGLHRQRLARCNRVLLPQ